MRGHKPPHFPQRPQLTAGQCGRHRNLHTPPQRQALLPQQIATGFALCGHQHLLFLKHPGARIGQCDFRVQNSGLTLDHHRENALQPGHHLIRTHHQLTPRLQCKLNARGFLPAREFSR